MKKIVVKETAKAKLPTEFGNFKISIFKSNVDDRPQVLLTKEGRKNGAVLVRLHSKCLTGDTFGSLKCDCGDQLRESLKKIEKSGGILIYLNQEGRDIGLENKIKSYALQDKGSDTVRANIELGLPVDARDYSVAAAILKFLKVNKIKLLTNNPDKIEQLSKNGVEVVSRIPLETRVNKYNKHYLRIKKKEMGHFLKLA